jgi:hypothetical protein
MRTLTERELNRTLLARQLLLKRSPTSIPETLERMGGLQAQYAPSMYIGLWSRMEGFHRDDLTRALERREVVQGTLLRCTIHLVSAADYWPFALAVRAARQKWWLRATRNAFTADALAEAAARLREHLAANGPIRRSELDKLVGKELSIGVGLWIDLVRVPPSGTWERRRADLFDSAENWLGPPSPALTMDAATELVIRRYLSGFGPSTPGELADWAGLTLGDVVPILDRLEVRRFRSENGQELIDLPGARLPDATIAAPPRLLPTWDAALLVHARRKRILPEEHRPLIFNTKMPQSVPTFLVDGAVAGSWKHDKGRIELNPFEPLTGATVNAVEEEGKRLAAGLFP